MREQLIRFLLGELDDEERRELRTLLRDNPELQRELAHLRECFAANQEENAEQLPPGRLAERTADRVTNSDEFDLESLASGATRMSSAGDPPAGVLGWSLADLTVAGGVMLALSMLVFPALRDSRDGTRLTTCQEHLRQLWLINTTFAQDHGGNYPRIRPQENAGILIAQLVEAGYAEPEDMVVLLKCPASPIANEIKAGRQQEIIVPPREQLRKMPPTELLAVTAKMSPCYGIRMPQKIGAQYVDLRIDSPRHLQLDPLFGEISGDPTNTMSSHHRGSMIEFVDRNGSVVSIRTDNPSVIVGDVDPFHNDLGMMAAGLGLRDVVLVPSDASPALEFAGPVR